MKMSILFILIYLVVFGGSVGVLGKLAFVSFSPIELIFLRIFISVIFFTCILLFQKKFVETIRLIYDNIGKFAVLSICGIGGGMILGFIGLNNTTAINYDLLFNMSAVFIAIFSVILLREKFSIVDTIFLALAIFGAVLVVTRGNFSFDIFDTKNFKGDLLVMLASVGWGIYSIFGSYISKKNININSFVVIYGSFLLSSIILFPYVIFHESLGFSNFLNIKADISVLILSILGTAILFWFWFYFINKKGGILASFVILLENVGGVILPMIILGESLSLPVFMGGFLIMGSIFAREYITARKQIEK